MAKKNRRFLQTLAQGAVLAAKNQNKISEFMDDMTLFMSVLDGDSHVLHALTNATIPVEKRLAALIKILDGQMELLTIKTLVLLTEHGLMMSFKDFSLMVEQTARENAHYHLCRAVSAVPLSDPAKQQLGRVLKKKFPGTIKIQYQVDPSIIGGLAVTCGDWRYSGTVQAKIRQLNKHLITT